MRTNRPIARTKREMLHCSGAAAGDGAEETAAGGILALKVLDRRPLLLKQMSVRRELPPTLRRPPS